MSSGFPADDRGRVGMVSALLVALPLAAAGVYAVWVSTGRVDDRLDELVRWWEEAEPDLERRIAALVMRNFRERLPPDSPWAEELRRDPGLEDELRARHLASLFARADSGAGRVGYHCRADFLARTAEEPAPPLSEASPNVRVADVNLAFFVRRRALVSCPGVELVPRGARLDEEVCDLLTTLFVEAGIEVRRVAAR